VYGRDAPHRGRRGAARGVDPRHQPGCLRGLIGRLMAMREQAPPRLSNDPGMTAAKLGRAIKV